MQKGYAICFNEWIEDERITNELALLLKISSLTAKNGHCFASNSYFSSLFKKTEVSISRKIKKLEKFGYIEIDYEKRGCEIIKRKIRLSKMLIDDYQKRQSTIIKNVKDNNTSINNTSINTNTSQKCDVRVPVSMNAEEFYEWTKKSSQAHIRLIGEWADTVKPDLTTKDQWSIYIKRNARIAQSLSVFSMEQIEKAYTEIKKELERLNYTPAMETLLKKLTK
jgi:hypothetical protein